jgi:DNA-directed RNA polymerase subunit RPC12/RpoP
LAAPGSTISDAGLEKLKAAPVEGASHVQHLGSWLLVGMTARVGLYEVAEETAERRVRADAVRLALDAVVMALGLGQRCVEGVRRLATSTAGTLMMATGMPSPTWVRGVLGRFAADEGGMKLHLRMAGTYLREAQATSSASGPVFYVDNHLRPYTGQEVIRRGWRMQDKRVRPGTSDYYVHDEDGRPVMRMASPSHASLTEWLSPIAEMLRLALGFKETRETSADSTCPRCSMKLWVKPVPRQLRFHDTRHSTAALP